MRRTSHSQHAILAILRFFFKKISGPDPDQNLPLHRASIYLQQQPGCSGLADAGRSESAAHGALIEFHRRRMAHFVGVVKRAVAPDVWRRLQRLHMYLRIHMYLSTCI